MPEEKTYPYPVGEEQLKAANDGKLWQAIQGVERYLGGINSDEVGLTKNILDDFRKRVYGEDRTNTLSDKPSKSLLTASGNLVPGHAARVIAFCIYTNDKLSSIRIDASQIDAEDDRNNFEEGFIKSLSELKSQVNAAFGSKLDKKKIANAIIAQLGRENLGGEGSQINESLKSLEKINDLYISSGNSHNDKVRGEVEAAERKYLKAPMVLEEVKKFKTISLDTIPASTRVMIKESLKNIEKGIVSEAIRDVMKDMKPNNKSLKSLSGVLDQNVNMKSYDFNKLLLATLNEVSVLVIRKR